jgi:hypothetical protein
MKQNIPCNESNWGETLELKPVPKILQRKKKEPKDPRISAKAYRQKPENKAKMKAYRQKNKLKINRTKFLWSLNHNFVTNPKQETLDKYGIVRDDSIQRYIHKTSVKTKNVKTSVKTKNVKTSVKTRKIKTSVVPVQVVKKKQLTIAEAYKDLESKGKSTTYANLYKYGFKQADIKLYRDTL